MKVPDKSPFWECDVLPKNTVLCLQLGVCNSDHTLKGSMLMVRRVIPRRRPARSGRRSRACRARRQQSSTSIEVRRQK